jgi:hypothetical protein
MIRITTDISGARRKLEQIAREMNRAQSAALNRTAEAAATKAAREISALTKIPVRDIRKRMRLTRATPDRLWAELFVGGYAPNLRLPAFRPVQNKVGVAASAWANRKTYKGAFVMPGGRVVTRTTNKRFPLKGLRGPSIRKTFMQRVVQQSVIAHANQVWRDRLTREVARRLGAIK